jgi:hypothetical protein
MKADGGTFYRAIGCSAEGNGVRETGRILELDKDTVSMWLEKAFKHTEAVSRYLIFKLHFEELQLDVFWCFVKRKRRIALP